MNMYQVILIAEDGEYFQEAFNTYSGAESYIHRNASRYGDDQELVIENKSAWNS
jgi:hypothetical protein